MLKVHNSGCKHEVCVKHDNCLFIFAAKLIPVGYGIKKLQINAVIEDDKISTDDLEEKITGFEDYVSSLLQIFH